MLKRIRIYYRVSVKLFKMAIQTGLEYPINLLGWALANPIQFILGFATIRFVIMEIGTLNGWDFGEVAFLYGLAVLSHGLSVVLFIQTWFIGSFVVHGDIDRFMLRPLNVLFQFLMCEFNLVGFTDMIPGIMIFIYGCQKVQFHWSFYNAMMLIVVLLGATLIRGALFLITGSIAFWTKSNVNFTGFNLNIMDKTTMYPLSMYPKSIQWVFTFLLPLGFISFYPASDFLNKSNGFSFPVGTWWSTIFVGFVTFALACKVFLMGLKRYESAGH